MSVERVTCPCCGYRTLPDGPGAYEICDVCGWEDDESSAKRPLVNDASPNGISLAEAQRRYERYGSIFPLRAVKNAPPPHERDPDWRPVRDPGASRYRDFLRDLTYLAIHEAETARDVVRAGGGERALGGLAAWTDAVSLLALLADRFGFGPDEIGLPEGFEPGLDLSPHPGSSRSVG